MRYHVLINGIATAGHAGLYAVLAWFLWPGYSNPAVIVAVNTATVGLMVGYHVVLGASAGVLYRHGRGRWIRNSHLFALLATLVCGLPLSVLAPFGQYKLARFAVVDVDFNEFRPGWEVAQVAVNVSASYLVSLLFVLPWLALYAKVSNRLSNRSVANTAGVLAAEGEIVARRNTVATNLGVVTGVAGLGLSFSGNWQMLGLSLATGLLALASLFLLVRR